jgi:phage-related protein
MFQNLTQTVLYAVIGFLIFTNVVGPWAAQRRAKRKAEQVAEDQRRKDKYDAMKAELTARRNKE